MLVAHFAASGSAALDLPAWALAYAVFAASVIVILVSRNRHVPRARPRTSAEDPARTGATGDAAAPSPEPTAQRIGQIVAAVVFWLFVLFCWFGPESLTQNIATLGLVGVLWSLGGWVAIAFGWVWEAIDPFRVFVPRRRRGADPSFPTPWWAPIPVFVTYVVVWVAWIEGDEPRHFAVWLTLYGVAMALVARRGGHAALGAWNPLPATLDLTAPITRPGKARARTRQRAIRARLGLIAAMLLGALGANSVAGTEWFMLEIGFDGSHDETAWVMAIFVVITLAVHWAWRGVETLLERARDEAGARPLGAMLGPIAGSVLLAQAISIGLTQAQNFVVLLSDPFAQGWNLFGTVYWQVSTQPLSPLTQGLVQVGVLLAGHLAALMMIGHAATDRAADGTTSARTRLRHWNASLPAMALVVVSGVVWTLVLLG